jgi:hypothetical protein
MLIQQQLPGAEPNLSYVVGRVSRELAISPRVRFTTILAPNVGQRHLDIATRISNTDG